MKIQKNRAEGECRHCGNKVHRGEGFAIRGGVEHGYQACGEAVRAAWVRLHGH